MGEWEGRRCGEKWGHFKQIHTFVIKDTHEIEEKTQKTFNLSLSNIYSTFTKQTQHVHLFITCFTKSVSSTCCLTVGLIKRHAGTGCACVCVCFKVDSGGPFSFFFLVFSAFYSRPVSSYVSPHPFFFSGVQSPPIWNISPSFISPGPIQAETWGWRPTPVGQKRLETWRERSWSHNEFQHERCWREGDEDRRGLGLLRTMGGGGWSRSRTVGTLWSASLCLLLFREEKEKEEEEEQLVSESACFSFINNSCLPFTSSPPPFNIHPPIPLSSGGPMSNLTFHWMPPPVLHFLPVCRSALSCQVPLWLTDKGAVKKPCDPSF